MKTAPPNDLDHYIAGFPHDVQEIRLIPFTLIKKMVEFRVKEAREKIAANQGKKHSR